MRQILTVMPLCFVLVACGDDGGGVTPDAPTAPAMITVSGTARKREGTNTSAASGVMVGAYANSDPNTAVATATTDASGNYTMQIATGGVAVDGYLKATLSGFLDTYLYPPEPLTGDYSGASLNILDTSTLGLLSGTLCANTQDAAKGVIAVAVQDENDQGVAGAMVSSTPAAAKYCYNSGGFPNKNSTMTDSDGIAYMLNLPPGEVTVTATKEGLTFQAHVVNARAGAFTTTPIQP